MDLKYTLALSYLYKLITWLIILQKYSYEILVKFNLSFQSVLDSFVCIKSDTDMHCELILCGSTSWAEVK